MTKINKYIIVIITAFFCFNIPAFAGPKLTDGLYNYLLIKLDKGYKRFAIAPVVYSHEVLNHNSADPYVIGTFNFFNKV